ncbi:MAG: site-2 protease family protein, partial [Anaerolineae bacterium]|nr:site-2 protease family protein [Anaerolineae bacterium]
LMFACVLLHELGHALQARGLGLSVHSIVMLPIGGLAQLEKSPSHSWQELSIALAGPVMNLGAAIVFGAWAYLLAPFSPGIWAQDLLLATRGYPALIRYLFWTNLVLFLFNMIPAFPMDGGRVLRAGLALITDYLSATRVAAWVGQGSAVLLALLGLFGGGTAGFRPNIVLILIALIIFAGAQYESIAVRRRRALVRYEAGDVCHPPERLLHPWDKVSLKLIRKLVREGSTLPVVVDNRLVGVITEYEIFKLIGKTDSVTIAHIMRPNFPTLRTTDTLWIAYQEMNASQLTGLPVFAGNVFQGMLTIDDLRDAWRLRPRRNARVQIPDQETQRTS